MKEKQHQSTWPEAAADLFDLLTGRKAEITYQLENLEVYVPLESGMEADHAVWKLNGTVKVRAREDS